MDLTALLDQMLSAIAAERLAVRDALGPLGHQTAVPVRDGIRLVDDPGAHVYRFTCDLDFLVADGTRVQVHTPGVRSAGEVVDHDPALGNIGFVLQDDLGDLVPNAKLTFDASFLLERLAGHLESLKSAMGAEGSAGWQRVHRAIAFLEGTEPPLPPVPVSRPKLSETQDRAVSFVVGQRAAYLWGPPGTGKTQTVANLVHELSERGDRVLLTAHTNVATDTALLRVLRESPLPRGSVVRVGFCGEDLRRYRIGLDDHVHDLLQERCAAEADEIERLCERVAEAASRPPAALIADRTPLPRKLQIAAETLEALPLNAEPDLAARVAELLELVERLERDVIGNARVVSSTLTGLYMSRALRDLRLETVIIDEASIASLVLTFVAACCATARAVAVGDFMQLPAIVLSEQPAARLWLGRHVFSSAGCDRAEREHPLRPMLHEQWRMHPHISRVVSRVFYASKLQDAPAVRAGAHAGPALLILDTSGLAATSENVASHSKLNHAHAAVVAQVVARATRARGRAVAEVAVIAPYRAQVRQIRDALRGVAPSRLRNGEIEVFTVHRFQGRDKELVIFDLVEAPGTMSRFVHEHYNPSAPNLINVAMSRAKERLIVVANLRHLRDTLGQETLVNRVFAEMRAAGALEVVAGDATDEPLLAQFLGEEPHGNRRH